MKITHIKKLCVDAHMCMIYEANEQRQWIGTQEAIYQVDEITLSKGSIKTLFDMPDADRKMEIGVEDIWRSELIPCDEEIDIELEGWAELHCMNPLYYSGEKVYPLTCENGAILFVREDYVKPAIRKNDYLVFKMARNRFGHPLVVIGNSTLVTGIVRPIPKKGAAELVDLLHKLGDMQAEGTPDAHASARKEAAEKTEPADGQIEMIYEVEGGGPRAAAGGGNVR